MEGHLEAGPAETCTAPGCVAARERGDEWIGPFCSVEPDGRVHMHHTDVLRDRVAARRVEEFADLCAELAERPDDVVLAWRYLSEHPIFHRPVAPPPAGRTAAELTAEELASIGSWFTETDDGMRDAWTSISRAGSGAVVVQIEHGPHLWPTDLQKEDLRTIPAEGVSSLDHRLDVAAATFEEAIVELAARVRAVYGDDRSQVGSYHHDIPAFDRNDGRGPGKEG